MLFLSTFLNGKQYFLFLQNIKSFKDSLWNILKPFCTSHSLGVAFSEFYIYKKAFILKSRYQSVSYPQRCKYAVMLKWLESCIGWTWVFPWQQFYFMINQLLYIIVILIRMDRHSVVYTHGSNLRTPFVILLSRFFTTALMLFSGSSYLMCLNFKITLTYGSYI